MGGPQLAENAPAKKRGELYGNRVQNIGRPSGSPSSRSGSPLPQADDSPLPRKRCVSTGGALMKGTPPRFTSGQPIPPLPPTPSPTLPFARRNSLAVDFGPNERVVGFGEVSRHADEDPESPSPSPSPLLGVRDAAELVAPSQTLGPTSSDAPPKNMDALSQAEQEPAVPGFGLQADSNSAPATALDAAASPQSSPEVVTVVEVTSAVELDHTVDPPLDEKPQSPYHQPLSVDASVTDPQPSEAALPDSPSTISHSLVAPNTATEDDSVLTLASTITPGSGDADDKEHDDGAASLLVSESPPTEERGTISIILPRPSIQVQSSPPSPDLEIETAKPEVKRSFTAVVHRKVTEMSAATAPTSSLSAPMTPQVTRVRQTGSAFAAEPHPSPGYGELAILLEEAALLEMKLTEGDGSELVEAALPKTPTLDTFTTDIRSVSSSTLTEHVKAPSTETASLSERSVSIPSIREPNMDIPEDEGDGRSLASTSASHRSSSHKRYLSSIRRLTSRRSSNYMPGAYPRDSISTCSEDSAPVATPSDHGDGSGFGITWPSVSPKKGGMGKSSSFADKLFNRNRTKSNISTVETGV
jgi:hypothetical protein